MAARSSRVVTTSSGNRDSETSINGTYKLVPGAASCRTLQIDLRATFAAVGNTVTINLRSGPSGTNIRSFTYGYGDFENCFTPSYANGTYRLQAEIRGFATQGATEIWASTSASGATIQDCFISAAK